MALAALIPAALLWSGGGREGDGLAEAETLATPGRTPTGWLWRTLRGGRETAAVPDRGGPGEHYRLAGVLIMQEGNGTERGDGDRRFAILDRLENGNQLILGEGEEDGGVRAVFRQPPDDGEEFLRAEVCTAGFAVVFQDFS